VLTLLERPGRKRLTRIPNGFINSNCPARSGISLTTSVTVGCGDHVFGMKMALELGVHRSEDAPDKTYTVTNTVVQISNKFAENSLR
jgi:hypothetical protein